MSNQPSATPAESLAHQVAVEVMGWEYFDGLAFRTDDVTAWAFSPDTSIRDAWLVVEEMESRGYWLILTRTDYRTPLTWEAELRYGDDGGRASLVYDETAPLAICHAALAAVRGE